LQGPGTGEFIAFRAGSGSSSKLIWVTTYVASKPPSKQQEWDAMGDQQQQTKELNDILLQYPITHPIHEFAANTTPNRILHFGLYHRKHKSTWYKDRVVLLGDSCHATLPYVGQGANQAIEDSIVLADCLSKYTDDDYTKAFEEYYDRRFHRTKRVVNVANILDRLYHSQNWFVQHFVNFLLSRFLRGGLVFKQIEKEIVEECPIKKYKQYRQPSGSSSSPPPPPREQKNEMK
jgi:salicylate hydroxylase